MLALPSPASRISPPASPAISSSCASTRSSLFIPLLPATTMASASRTNVSSLTTRPILPSPRSIRAATSASEWESRPISVMIGRTFSRNSSISALRLSVGARSVDASITPKLQSIGGPDPRLISTKAAPATPKRRRITAALSRVIIARTWSSISAWA